MREGKADRRMSSERRFIERRGKSRIEEREIRETREKREWRSE